MKRSIFATTQIGLVAVGLAVCATSLQAASLSMLDFESANQYADNFYLGYSSSGGSAVQTDPADINEPNNDYLSFPGTGTNNTSATVSINTFAGTRSYNNSDTFGPAFTISFDMATNQQDSDILFYLYDTASTGNNLIVRIGTSYGSNEDIHFLRDGNLNIAGASTGTQFSAEVTSSGGSLSGGTTTIDILTPATDAQAAAGTGFLSGSISYNLNPGTNDGGTLSLTLGAFTSTLTLADDTHIIADPAIAIRYATYNVSNSSKAWRIDNLAVTEVPEPATLALLGIGGLLIAGRRRK